MRNICLIFVCAIGCLSACASSSSGTVARDEPPTSEPTPTPATATPTAPVADLDTGDVALTLDGNPITGSGIAFRSGTEVHVRLLVGTPDEHLQFDLIGDESQSVFTIEAGELQPAVIVGQDAVANDYEVVDDGAPNQFTLDTSEATRVAGTLELSVIFRDDPTPLRIIGQFVVEAGADGVTDWSCDFGAAAVTSCGFT